MSVNEYGQPDPYNPVVLDGQVISGGLRPSAARYEAVREFCKRFNRPFSVLDIGAAEGYFSLMLAHDFPEATVIAVEGNHKTGILQHFDKDKSDKLILLHRHLDLQTLKDLKAVHYFDVVLALNITHHFRDPWQEVVDTIVSMSSHCFFEHPNPQEEPTLQIERVRNEVISLGKYDGQAVAKTACTHLNVHNPSKDHSKIFRTMHLLRNPAKPTLMRHRFAPYDLQDWREERAVAEVVSDFDSCQINYLIRDEERAWVHGIDLGTFLKLNGVYPPKKKIKSLLQELPREDYPDLDAPNVILTGDELKLVDQQPGGSTYRKLHTGRQLIKHLQEQGLL